MGLLEALDALDLRYGVDGYLTDPAGWVSARLGEHLWSRQIEILTALTQHRRVAVKSAHGVGKSHVASRAIAWWLDVHPPGTAFVVSTAPTAKQVEAILWRYIGQAARKAEARGTPFPGRVLTTEWKLGNELIAFGRKPADHDEAAFQGIHAEHVLVVLDEASGIPEQLWHAADSLTSNDGCALLAIGNPSDPGSYFARACNLWHTITISAYDTPNLTGEQVPDHLRKVLVSRNWVDEKKVDWGEESALYCEKVLGEFPTDATDQIVRASDLARCRLTPDPPLTGDLLEPVELGVDVGGGGDETVIRERRGLVAGREWRSQTDRPEKIVPMILHAIRETGATAVKVDSIGVGFGVVGELRNLRLPNCRMVQVNVASRASKPDKFANLRAELWWNLGRGLSERQGWDLSSMDNGDTTCAQLLTPRWSLDTSGRILVEKKDEIIKRLGRSPDNADALLLAYFAAGRARVRIVG